MVFQNGSDKVCISPSLRALASSVLYAKFLALSTPKIKNTITSHVLNAKFF